MYRFDFLYFIFNVCKYIRTRYIMIDFVNILIFYLYKFFLFWLNFNLKFLYIVFSHEQFRVVINTKIGRTIVIKYDEMATYTWNTREMLTRSDIDPYRANRKYKKWYTTKEFTDTVGGLKLSFPNSRPLHPVSSIPALDESIAPAENRIQAELIASETRRCGKTPEWPINLRPDFISAAFSIIFFLMIIHFPAPNGADLIPPRARNLRDPRSLILTTLYHSEWFIPVFASCTESPSTSGSLP